jgi:adenylate cyclase class 1
LAAAGAKRDSKLLLAIRKLLRRGDDVIRRRALAALIDLRDPAAPEALARLAAQAPDDPEVRLMVCRLDQAGFNRMFAKLQEPWRPEFIPGMLSLIARLKPKDLAQAVKLVGGEAGKQARKKVADFLLAHERQALQDVPLRESEPLPVYASPPEPAAPEAPPSGLFAKAVSPASLAEVVQSGARVQGGHYSNQTLHGEIEGAAITDATLCNAHLPKTRFKDCSFSYLDAKGMGLDHAMLEGCAFKAVRLCQSRWSDAVVQDCSFVNCDFAAAVLRGCSFTNCDFTGCLFDYAELENLQFDNCRLTACLLQETRLIGAAGRELLFDLAFMHRLEIRDMRIQGAALTDCLLQNCRLSNLRLEDVDCVGVQFWSCELWASDVFDPDFMVLEEAALERALDQAAWDPKPPPDSWREWDGPARSVAVRVLDFWFMFRDAARNAQAALRCNRQRLQWAMAKSPAKVRSFLALLPSLAAADLSACAADAGGARLSIEGSSPGFGRREALARLISGARLSEPESADLRAEGLYTIGSTGSIAQNESSDIDAWLVMAPNQDEKKIEALRRKLSWIEQWAAQELKLEVHFFVMDPARTRDNDFGASDEEGAGSTQALLLKEEFYRTMILLAGKLPVWWLIPAGAGEQNYHRYAAALESAAGFLKGRTVDLGPMAGVPAGEFFGASLWQIAKALKSPFKSVLKLGLLEKHLGQSANASTLLCEKLKGNLLSGMRGLWEIDPYALLFKEVHDAYQAGEHREALRLVRLAFAIKTGAGLPSPAPGAGARGAGASLAEFFFPPVSFRLGEPGENMPDLQTFEARERAARQTALFMARAYDRIRKRFGRTKAVNVTGQDMTKLGRRISAFFSRRENKIARIPFLNPQKDAFASLALAGEESGGMVRAWLAKGAAPTPEGKTGKLELLRKDSEPIRLLCWLVVNGVYDPGQYLSIDPVLAPVSAADVKTLLAGLYDFFPIKSAFSTDLDESLHPQCATAAYLVVNLLRSRTNHNIREASLLYATNWGEFFCLPRAASLEKITTNTRSFLEENIPTPLSPNIKVEVFTPPKSKCPKIILTSVHS